MSSKARSTILGSYNYIGVGAVTDSDGILWVSMIFMKGDEGLVDDPPSGTTSTTTSSTTTSTKPPGTTNPPSPTSSTNAIDQTAGDNRSPELRPGTTDHNVRAADDDRRTSSDLHYRCLRNGDRGRRCSYTNYDNHPGTRGGTRTCGSSRHRWHRRHRWRSQRPGGHMGGDQHHRRCRRRSDPARPIQQGDCCRRHHRSPTIHRRSVRLLHQLWIGLQPRETDALPQVHHPGEPLCLLARTSRSGRLCSGSEPASSVCQVTSRHGWTPTAF